MGNAGAYADNQIRMGNMPVHLNHRSPTSSAYEDIFVRLCVMIVNSAMESFRSFLPYLLFELFR